jgi:hypothetical protein
MQIGKDQVYASQNWQQEMFELCEMLSPLQKE